MYLCYVCTFLLCYIMFKILSKCWHVFFFSLNNFNIFLYQYHVNIIFCIISYFNYYFYIIFLLCSILINLYTMILWAIDIHSMYRVVNNEYDGIVLKVLELLFSFSFDVGSSFLSCFRHKKPFLVNNELFRAFNYWSIRKGKNFHLLINNDILCSKCLPKSFNCSIPFYIHNKYIKST